MKKFLGICMVLAVLAAVTVPVMAQDPDDHRQGDRDHHGYRGSRLSADDQQRFDSYYSRWQEYRRTNNRGEMESMEKRMRDLMSRNHIPSDVRFDQIASNGGRGYDNHYQRQARLSSEDQQRFDSYYSRWVQYRRTNNRDEMESMEKRMREVMARYHIPSNVPFDEVASRR